VIIEKLKNTIPGFSPLSKDNFDLLISGAKQIELTKGQHLLSEGQICNHLYFVENGFLRTFVIRNGDEINMNFTFDGNFISDLNSLKKQEPSQLYIIAEEKSIITQFDKNILYKLYARSSEIETFCRRILGHLYLESNEHLNFYRLKTPKERYEYLLKNKPLFVQRISISQLSSYIGVARETLSRTRKNK
jgi:CRP-like cAMP-binding protein